MLNFLIYIILSVAVFYLFYKLVSAVAHIRQERKYINSLFL